jgi:hypothetical protein
MARIDDVKKICRSLADRGWKELFSRHGLNLLAADLASELERKLDIDRNQPGFDDFCLKGKQAVQPGDPACSLLYHALASSEVLPTKDGKELPLDAYASVEELDAIENYIYSRKPFVPPKSGEWLVGVFAYAYRPAESNAHGYHADLVFSRTGIARAGTKEAVWYGPWRSFRPDPPSHDGMSVCPARYGAFIAEKAKQKDTDLVPLVGRRDEQNDPLRTFYVPVHKLFNGPDCVEGAEIHLRFGEYHRNEKLRRLHTIGSLKLVAGFDVNAAPFIRDSLNGDAFVTLPAAGASVLVMPTPQPTVVRAATQTNSISKNEEIARFVVPRKNNDNRLSTSLQILAVKDARRVPQYINIRHRVVRKSGSKLVIEDMRSLPEKDFDHALKHGGYEAAHYIDDTGEGNICVTVGGLAQPQPSLPAYSLVAAPHFFPLADQLEISNWVRRNFFNFQEHFAQGAPWPLCEGRRPVNIELPRADSQGDRAFSRQDETVTAIVGPQPRSREHVASKDRRKLSVSFLTDAASNEFDPGWDVSLSGDDHGHYLAAYGLGSPYPEDAKLCAALNSFWPAAAPDAARTFKFDTPTAMPLLDEELGYHPRHPLVLDKTVKSSFGWDGEQGPFFEKVRGRQYVNLASIDRSDYVSNALSGKIDIRKTSSVDGPELIARMDALRRCIRVLPGKNHWVSKTDLMLVTAEDVEKAKGKGDSGDALPGARYRYVFADLAADPEPTQELTRDQYRVNAAYECLISQDAVAYRKDGGKWKTVTISGLDARRDDKKGHGPAPRRPKKPAGGAKPA